jgi:two-component system, chemotaxis family, protein-glutamate methylesterase/glutaminase
VKVLVVDDSAVVRQALTMILSTRRGVVVAAAADPLIATDKIRRQRPDVIVLDLEMPRMDGLTFLRSIMASPDPIPVVVCSGLARHGTEIALQALEQGAVAVVERPRLGLREFLHEQSAALIETVTAAAQVRLRRRAAPPVPRPLLTADAVLPPRPPASHMAPSRTIVAIGASTGGTEALREILEALPVDAPGIAIVQHMPAGFTRAFADRLNGICRIEVKEAEGGDVLQPGRALIAPGNRHLLVRRSGTRYAVDVVDGPAVSRHRPSVDVLFRSVAQAAGPHALGIVLTGMGRDGADGLREMKTFGAATVAQDEASSVVFGMPKEAIAAGGVDEVASLSQMAALILRRAVVLPGRDA